MTEPRPVSTDPAPPTRLPRWLPPIVALLTLAAYGPTLLGYMLSDDFYLIRYVREPLTNVLTAKLLLRPAAHDPEVGLQFFRPLAYLWLWLKIRFWQGWLPGLRFDQLLLHAAISLSVGALALRWTRDRVVAAGAAVIFVAAPGHLRWMATIFGSNGLWPALCSLWAVIWTYDAVACGRRSALALAAAVSVAGLLSYEQVAVVPLLAVVMAYIAVPGERRYLVPAGAGALALTAAYFALRFLLFGGVGGYTSVEGDTWIATQSFLRLAGQLAAVEWATAGSIVWPWQPPLVAPSTLLTAVALLAWTVLAGVACIRQPAVRRPLAAATLWIAGTAVPLVGVFREPHAWHAYIYFGSAGGAIVAALIVRGVVPTRAQTGAVAAIAMVYLLATWAGLRIWFETWDEARAFVEQLEAAVPEEATPAIVAVEHLPGPSVEGHLLFNAPTDHEAYTDYLPDRLFLRAWPVEWPYPFPYSGNRAWPPPQDLHLHWFSWDAASHVLTRVSAPAPVPGTPVEWDFADPVAARAWRPAFQLHEIARGTRPATYATEGAVPLFAGPRLPPTVGTPIYADLTMRVQTPAGGPGVAEWHFRTRDTPDPSPAHVIRFWIEQDGQPHTYRVPLVNNPQLLLDGPPTQLDLRPSTTAGALVQLQALSLLPRPADGT